MVTAANGRVIYMGLARVRKLLQEDSNDRCSSERLCGTLTENEFLKCIEKSTKPPLQNTKECGFQIVTYLLF
ncbi:MAG: hypothetical protein ACFWUL_01520 [Dialister sp.]|jgi:hypothetical protein